MNLFIDNNRLLIFYEYRVKELTRIKDIIDLIKQKKIVLWLPEQVKNEFYRNRERFLLDCLERMEKLAPATNLKDIPNIPESTDTLDKISSLQKDIEICNGKIKSLIEKIRADFRKKIGGNSFIADKIVEDLFSTANLIPYDEVTVNKALIRCKLGNPPGKNNSYGDSLIWQTLLKEVPNGQDLYFVGFDKHFKSELDENNFSPFLLKEWGERKKSKLISFNRLWDFIKAKISAITVSKEIAEQEKIFDNENRPTYGYGGALFEALKNLNITAEQFRNMIAYNVLNKMASPDTLKAFERQFAIFKMIAALSPEAKDTNKSNNSDGKT